MPEWLRSPMLARCFGRWPSCGADTGTSTGCPMRPVLGDQADVECDLIRPHPPRRGPEPCKSARFSRPPGLTRQHQDESRQRRAEGATLRELVLSYKEGTKEAAVFHNACSTASGKWSFARDKKRLSKGLGVNCRLTGYRTKPSQCHFRVEYRYVVPAGSLRHTRC